MFFRPFKQINDDGDDDDDVGDDDDDSEWEKSLVSPASNTTISVLHISGPSETTLEPLTTNRD